MTYTVDLDALEQLVGAMSRHLATMEALDDDVERVVRSFGTHWDGEAASAATIAHRRWLHGLGQMRATLDQLRRAAEDAQANYSHAGAAASRMWQL